MSAVGSRRSSKLVSFARFFDGVTVLSKGSLVLVLVSILLCVGILELALRGLGYPIPAVGEQPKHAQLGFTMDAGREQLDDNGFRNAPGTPVDIVAIGDSHTFGFGVQAQQSWPQQFADKIDQPVYNMGMGGYGILQYRVLTEMALQLGASKVVVGFFPENDLDNCALLVGSEYWQQWAQENDISLESCRAYLDLKAHYQGIPTSVFNIALVSFWHHNISDLTQEQEGRTCTLPSKVVQVEYGSQHQTAFRCGRLSEGNAEEEAIIAAADASMLEVMQVILDEMVAVAVENDMQMGFLIIPSKADILVRELGPDHAVLKDVLQRRVKHKGLITNAILAVARENGIAVLSAQSALQFAMWDGAQIYRSDTDWHPTEIGYAAYANAALSVWERMQRKNP